MAYGISKHVNQLRVQAAAVTWGDHGAGVNPISPGIILTPFAREERASAGGPVYQSIIDTSAAGRVGTTVRSLQLPRTCSEWMRR